MNIDLFLLVGQPRNGERELKVIAAKGKRSELAPARKKVKAEDYVFIGELHTSGTRLKNRRHFEAPAPKEEKQD